MTTKMQSHKSFYFDSIFSYCLRALVVYKFFDSNCLLEV